jgi:ureidoglycolate lyase
MSGYSDYTDSSLESRRVHNVPTLEATTENFKEYGIIYDSLDRNQEIIIKPWNVTGRRKLMTGTGVGGGTVSGNFEYEYMKSFDSTYLKAMNHAVNGNYTTGICYGQTKNDYPQYILTREANYHPDGGQLFVPEDRTPFILLLALPTDDIKPEHFVAFKFDGTKSAQIFPNIWHQPVFPLVKNATFFTKQGAVHACVGVDTLNEFDTWLKIELR